jgi:hypothetical protein
MKMLLPVAAQLAAAMIVSVLHVEHCMAAGAVVPPSPSSPRQPPPAFEQLLAAAHKGAARNRTNRLSASAVAFNPQLPNFTNAPLKLDDNDALSFVVEDVMPKVFPSSTAPHGRVQPFARQFPRARLKMDEPIKISSTNWSLSFAANGSVTAFDIIGSHPASLVDTDLPSPGQPALVSVVLAPKYSNAVLRPSRVTFSGDMLVATFATPAGNTAAAIRVTGGASAGLSSEWVTFTVVGVTPAAVWDAAVSRLRFFALPLKFGLQGCATLASVGYSDDVAVALLPGSLNTSVGGLPRMNDRFGPSNPAGAGCSLSASAFSDSVFVNSSAALWAGARTALPAAMRLGEKGLGLPSPRLGGGGKLSPESALEVARGYFLIDVPPQQFNRTVEYALTAGFGYIVLLDSWIDTTPGQEAKYGHYNVSSSWGTWGRGTWSTPIAGLHAAVQYANARGVKVGLHTMSGNIAQTDSYVTPAPDPRLATHPGFWTLGKNGVSADAKTIQLAGNVTYLDKNQNRPGAGLSPTVPVEIWVDDELMHTTALNTTTGVLSGLVRGLHGTKAQSHAAGAHVRVMAAGSGPTYLPRGTLIDEIASNIARAVDGVGADTTYFDGLGNLLPITNGGSTERFGCSRMQLAFWKSAKRQVIAQSDTEGELEIESGHLWHMDSRSGQSDFAATDSKAFMDGDKLVTVKRAKRELFTPDLGWWGYLPFTQSYYATMPDEVAYMASRAAGWGGSPALETEFDKLGANGRTDEALSSMAPWGRLILPDSAKALLRIPSTDFELEQNSTGWYIRPVKYHPRHVANPAEPASCDWSVNASFDSSTVGVRLRALPAIGGAAAGQPPPDNIDLLALAADADVVSRTIGCHGQAGVVMPGTKPPILHHNLAATTSFGASIFMNASVEQAPPGPGAPAGITKALRLNYSANGGLPNASVGCVQNLFSKPINISLNRPLSATVFGDGSAAVLDVQLCTAGGTTCVHYFVAVNHVGWRTVALSLPEARRLFDHMQVCAVSGDMTCITAMRGFPWAAVTQVNLLLTAAARSTVFVGCVVAQREHPANLTAGSATVSVGASRLVLPKTLRAQPCLAPAPGLPTCGLGEGCADYTECVSLSDLASCRSWDATNHLLNTSSTDASQLGAPAVRTAADDSGLLAVSFGVAEKKDAARAEVTIIERSTDLLGPFSARPATLKTTDEAAALRLPTAAEDMFQFELGGVSSHTILKTWSKTVSTVVLRHGLRGHGNRTRTRTTYYEQRDVSVTPGCSGPGGDGCAAFGLQLIVEQTTYHQPQNDADSDDAAGRYTADEWRLLFRQTGSATAQKLCVVNTLDIDIALPSAANLTLETRYKPVSPPATEIPSGEIGWGDRFRPLLYIFPSGASHVLGPAGGSTGRSSEVGLPFWSAWTTSNATEGPSFSGVTVSVGWSGEWRGTVARPTNASILHMSVGQQDFCAAVPAGGEQLRFPSVMVVNWQGSSPQVGTNAHRRIVCEHKTPRDPATGQPLGMITHSIAIGNRNPALGNVLSCIAMLLLVPVL